MSTTNVQEQISREASDIEQRKVAMMDSAKALADAANVNALSGKYLTPDYQVAGMSPDQLNALDLGRQGIGAYQPYMASATKQYNAAGNTVQQGVDTLLGADTRGQFTGAQAAMNRAAIPIEQMGQSAQLATQGVGLIGQGAQGLTAAQQQANQYAQANLGQAQGYLGSSADMANRYAQANMGQSLSTLGQAERIAAGAAPTNFAQAQGTLGQGIGALQGAAQMYDPTGVQKFMNPYQQQVIDESIKQINRQGDISQQNLQAQAARSGAFGGSREGVQRAELERGLAAQRNAAIVGGLSTGYQNAAQQAQQAFEAQQGRQLAQAQGLQGAAGLQGQFGQTQQQQALQQAQALQGIGGLYGQQSLQQAQLGQGAAGLTSNIGQTLGQQQLQQAQLGQGAAGLQGNLSGQLAGLAGMYGNVAGQQANIYGQQSQLGQSMAQGIGNLASQQFGIGRDIAQGLGSLGAQQGNLATQGAALGQAAQGMGQQDVNFLYNLGSSQQKQLQSEMDASRQNELTQNMQPYQQMGFVSDIYRGAPTSSMSLMQQSQATPSPFQQVAGLGIAGLSAAAAGSRAGII
jgi:hypothetical protein